jgi:hypothetical protein
MPSKNREQRAVDQFACPTCKARPGQPCTGVDGHVLRSLHGPGCHPLRRKLLAAPKLSSLDAVSVSLAGEAGSVPEIQARFVL